MQRESLRPHHTNGRTRLEIDLKERRKGDMKDDQSGSATNQAVEVVPNDKQNVFKHRPATIIKTQNTLVYLLPCCTRRSTEYLLMAKAEDDACTAVEQFYNAYQKLQVIQPPSVHNPQGRTESFNP